MNVTHTPLCHFKHVFNTKINIHYLELAAELFLDEDFSLALRKLLARLRSLLKLLTLLRAGLRALCGVSRGELGGSGERHILGEGDLMIKVCSWHGI